MNTKMYDAVFFSKLFFHEFHDVISDIFDNKIGIEDVSKFHDKIHIEDRASTSGIIDFAQYDLCFARYSRMGVNKEDQLNHIQWNIYIPDKNILHLNFYKKDGELIVNPVFYKISNEEYHGIKSNSKKIKYSSIDTNSLSDDDLSYELLSSESIISVPSNLFDKIRSLKNG